MLGSRRHGGDLKLGIVTRLGPAGGMLPIGSRRRRLLYQSTHSRVANSTASRQRQGPRRRITSVLNRPLLLDAVRPTGQGVVVGITDAADGGLDTGLEQTLCVPSRNALPAPVAVVDGAALHRTAVVQRLLQGIEDEVGMRRPRDPAADDAAGKDVDEGHVHEALPGRDIGEILLRK